MVVYHRTPPETIADGLRRRGYQVYGPDHQDEYHTTTAVCHGGDTPRGLSIGPDGDGGTLVYCHTRGCGSRGDMAQVLDRVREQAGIQPMVRAGGDRRHVATYTGEGAAGQAGLPTGHTGRAQKDIARPWPDGRV